MTAQPVEAFVDKEDPRADRAELRKAKLVSANLDIHLLTSGNLRSPPNCSIHEPPPAPKKEKEEKKTEKTYCSAHHRPIVAAGAFDHFDPDIEAQGNAGDGKC
jgi:hypothetical protein